jgi:hypothetical protein
MEGMRSIPSLALLALLLGACSEPSSSQTSTTGTTTSGTTTSGSTGSGGGDGCSATTSGEGASCAALEQPTGLGLSASFVSGTLLEVHADSVTIDAGAAGQVVFHWSGDDLTTVFAAGEAVSAISEGAASQGYTGIETAKARALVATSISNTSVSAPAPVSMMPGLSFSFTPECSWEICDAACGSEVRITTQRLSLIVTAGAAPSTLKVGETATVGSVIVHHGGAKEASADSAACNIDFVNEAAFTLLQKLP